MVLGYCANCDKQLPFVHCEEHNDLECSVCNRPPTFEEELKFYEGVNNENDM